jgi:hypothetical protein
MDNTINVLHDIPLLHKKVLLGKNNTICEYIMLCCNSVTGLFFAAICKASDAKGHYHLVRYDINNNGVFGLDYDECLSVINSLIRFDSRMLSKKSIDFQNAQKILESIKDNDKEKNRKGIINIDNLNFHIINNKNEFTIAETNLSINSESFDLASVSIIAGSLVDAALFDMTPTEQYISKLNKCSYLSDITIKVKYKDISIQHYGIVINAVENDNILSGYSSSYEMERLFANDAIDFLGKDIANPFTIINYIIKSSHLDNVTFSSDGYKEHKNNYLVVTSLNNVKFSVQSFSVGNVRFNEPLYIPDEITEKLRTSNNEKSIPVWTSVYANNHYDAYKIAIHEIAAAIDLICFFMKCDMFISQYGLSKKYQPWNIWDTNIPVTLSDTHYVENCITGESICSSGLYNKAKKTKCVNQCTIDDIETEWISRGYESGLNGNAKCDCLLLAMKWINKSWSTNDEIDIIIFSITSLEFCLNGETGDGIVDEKLKELGLPNESLKKIRKKILNGIFNNLHFEDQNIEQEIIYAIIEKCRNQLNSNLNMPSFNSKLIQLISRLNIPINSNETHLLEKARTLRNNIIHGSAMESINELDAIKLRGIISRIISFKFKSVVGDIQQ